MKDNVEIYTMALIRVLHDSDEFKAYEKIRKKVAEDEDLHRRINEYRKACFKMQNSEEYEGENGQDIYSRMREFQAANNELTMNPLAEEYLKCELAIVRILQKIARKVVGSVELDLGDIADDIHP